MGNYLPIGQRNCTFWGLLRMAQSRTSARRPVEYLPWQAVSGFAELAAQTPTIRVECTGVTDSGILLTQRWVLESPGGYEVPFRAEVRTPAR
jgi:hypothetical protein